DDLGGGVRPLLGHRQIGEGRDELAGERIGLRQALIERRLAELTGLAVVRVLARGAGHGARVAEADLARVAAGGEVGAAADAARARRQTRVVDALVAGGAAHRRIAAQAAAGARVGVGAGVERRAVGAF